MACLGVGAALGLVLISVRPRALKDGRHRASKLYRPGKPLALYATTDSHVLVLTRLARIRKTSHHHCSSRTSASGLRRQ